MNLEKLFEMQGVLDEHIIKEKGLEGEDLIPNKILALQVEIGELANEWRGFKHWSNKGPSEKDVILGEYVDGLHFILSIGLELNKSNRLFSIPDKDFGVLVFSTISQQFRSLFYNISILDSDYFDPNEFLGTEYLDSDYIKVFRSFLGLGQNLGFTQEEIEQAYFKKNEVNHQRQEDGY